MNHEKDCNASIHSCFGQCLCGHGLSTSAEHGNKRCGMGAVRRGSECSHCISYAWRCRTSSNHRDSSRGRFRCCKYPASTTCLFTGDFSTATTTTIVSAIGSLCTTAGLLCSSPSCLCTCSSDICASRLLWRLLQPLLRAWRAKLLLLWWWL